VLTIEADGAAAVYMTGSSREGRLKAGGGEQKSEQGQTEHTPEQTGHV